MAKNKKKSAGKQAKAAEKSLKNASKAEKKDKKLSKKLGEEDDDMDIDEILANYKKELEEFTAVKIELSEPPSKRVNGTMCASPIQGKKEIFLFGGETTIKKPVQTKVRKGEPAKTIHETTAVFYNDLYHYTIDTDQWRKITSPNSPLPRSGHAMCAHPSGIILTFGGEFSSPKENTFYHYGDTWILDAESKEWTKIDQKKGIPESRSGHRMTVWKNYILLHGGFKDTGESYRYFNDLWAFDVTDYKWHEIDFPKTAEKPEARSGHSFIPHPDGGLIWGGYSKVKAARDTQKGKVHTDAWLLKMKPDLKGVTWERRKKAKFAPSPRVGCSMVQHRGRGILFGGVYDDEETEEDLKSTFFNNLYAYQTDMNKWFGLSLRARKKNTSQAVTKNRTERREKRDAQLEATLSEILEGKLEISSEKEGSESPKKEEDEDIESKKQYPIVNTLPHERYNVTATVVDDTLFLFGGIYEYNNKEFHLDSMYSIDLGKLDGCKVYWEDLSELNTKDENSDDEWDDEDDEGEDDEDEDEEMDDDNDNEAPEEIEEDEEDEDYDQDEIPDDRPWLPHPKPHESLKQFYERTANDLLKWAMSQDHEARGKDLKRVAFELAEDRWWERREVVRRIEEKYEEEGGIGNIIEKDTTKDKTRR